MKVLGFKILISSWGSIFLSFKKIEKEKVFGNIPQKLELDRHCIVSSPAFMIKWMDQLINFYLFFMFQVRKLVLMRFRQVFSEKPVNYTKKYYQVLSGMSALVSKSNFFHFYLLVAYVFSFDFTRFSNSPKYVYTIGMRYLRTY